MIRREAKFQTLFRHWIKKNGPSSSAAFELKQTQINSIPFSCVQDHQLAALQAASSPGMLYKIPDDSRGIKPFDMVLLRRAFTYIAIRYPKFFVLITTDEFIKEKANSKRKSLTAKRAQEIAAETVYFKKR